MADPYLGEIRIFAFGFTPSHWLPCNGQALPIQQYAALFSILGTTYGGNGTTNFQLPNLQGNVAINWGNGAGLSPYVLGEVGGVAEVTLNQSTAGAHSHAVAANATPNAYTAAGNFPASAPAEQNLYGPATDTAMYPQILTSAGSSQPHNNMQPYLVLQYCISIAGIFPSRG